MTTHDQRTEATHTTEPFEPATPTAGEPSAGEADPGRHAEAEGSLPNQDQASVAPPSGTEAPPGTTEPAKVESESSTERALFADDELAGLRAGWESVQAGFVDDPRECVQQADRLVSDVVDQLTTGFTAARSRLEEQWGRGEEASTEDLRLALKRYREFFQRLLAV